MAIVITDTYTDGEDMQCPADWENGFKEALVERFGTAERAASDRRTGNWTGSFFDFTLINKDLRFTQQLASAADRYWSRALTVKMTTRANRALKGTPYTVFVGPIVTSKPSRPLKMDIRLGDIVSRQLITDNDNALIPWRLIRDCGLFNPDATIITATTTGTFAPYESVGLDSPEQIIYGEHRRIPDVDPASPQGFEYTPRYLGTWTIAGTDYHTWMVCGHACANLPDVNAVAADGTRTTLIGVTGWVIPHQPEFTGLFGAVYVDIRSHTYGVDRRYTLILAEVGSDHADECAAGEETLTCFVEGVEPAGDGSGTFIADRIEQYRHFMVNFVANAGALSYQSGPWLTSPTWDVFGVPVSIIDTASFTACSAIAAARLPLPVGESPPPDYAAGYVGAAILGAREGERASVARWIADWNRSCDVRNCITHEGQFHVFMLHPTEAIKAAAPLLTDAWEILEGSFDADVAWNEQANRQPFKADFEHLSGEWKTAGLAESSASVANYEREIPGEVIEYPFAPGITAAYHLARLSMLLTEHPPKPVTAAFTIGPNDQGFSAGYLEPGDYVRYRAYPAVANSRDEIRLMQIEKVAIDVGARKVWLFGLDCEDLIGYDAAPTDGESVSPINETCDSARVITQDPFTPVALTQSTAAHATDLTIGVSPTTWSGTEAYHAAWFEFTPWANGTLFLTTVHSEYDTQMAVFTGACGALTEVQYNDNDPYNNRTSVLEFPVTSGTTYKILVAGYGPDDGGNLTLGLYFTEPE